jgi:predicted nuclease of predicted toxin-antitoxin system
MYLLIDECCAKRLAAVARARGHRVERSIEIKELGRGATDDAIFAYARHHGAIVVTINRADFIALGSCGNDHAGVILLPSLERAPLTAIFEEVLPVAERVFGLRANAFVEIDSTGRITSFSLPEP